MIEESKKTTEKEGVVVECRRYEHGDGGREEHAGTRGAAANAAAECGERREIAHAAVMQRRDGKVRFRGARVYVVQREIWIVGARNGQSRGSALLLKKPQSFKKARGTPHHRVLREQLAADIDKRCSYYYYWKIVRVRHW